MRGSRLAGMGFGLSCLKCLPAEPAARFPCDSPETRVRLALLSCRPLVARQPRRGDPADASAALLPATLPRRSAPGSTPQRREKSDFPRPDTPCRRSSLASFFPCAVLSPRRSADRHAKRHRRNHCFFHRLLKLIFKDIRSTRIVRCQSWAHLTTTHNRRATPTPCVSPPATLSKRGHSSAQAPGLFPLHTGQGFGPQRRPSPAPAEPERRADPASALRVRPASNP